MDGLIDVSECDCARIFYETSYDRCVEVPFINTFQGIYDRDHSKIIKYILKLRVDILSGKVWLFFFKKKLKKMVRKTNKLVAKIEKE